MRVSLVGAAVRSIGLGQAIFEGRTHDAAAFAVFALMAFGALPFVATWPEQ